MRGILLEFTLQYSLNTSIVFWNELQGAEADVSAFRAKVRRRQRERCVGPSRFPHWQRNSSSQSFSVSDWSTRAATYQAGPQSVLINKFASSLEGLCSDQRCEVENTPSTSYMYFQRRLLATYLRYLLVWLYTIHKMKRPRLSLTCHTANRQSSGQSPTDEYRKPTRDLWRKICRTVSTGIWYLIERHLRLGLAMVNID